MVLLCTELLKCDSTDGKRLTGGWSVRWRCTSSVAGSVAGSVAVSGGGGALDSLDSRVSLPLGAEL